MMETPPSGSEIRLTASGDWLADGEPITHERALEYLARNLQHDAQGYFIPSGPYRKPIIVEDTPYFVLSWEEDGAAGFEVLLNDGTREKLAPETLYYRPGRLTCRVKGSTEEAKFLHAAYHSFLKNVEEDDQGFFLTVGGKRVGLQP